MVFESENPDVAGFVLGLHSERIPIFGFELLCHRCCACLVLRCQGFEQTHFPEAFSCVQFPFHVQRKGVIVG